MQWLSESAKTRQPSSSTAIPMGWHGIVTAHQRLHGTSVAVDHPNTVVFACVFVSLHTSAGKREDNTGT
eukprot:m.1262368 g.1262368  ORF g.1262368 m.1262368 type:complete len:69 (+) comp24733_c0_seq50:3378-3584(+)